MKPQVLKIINAMKVCFISSIFAATTGTYADDTEVFYSANVSKPNLLFVLDISGSMRTLVPNSGSSSNHSVSHSMNRQIVNENDDAEQASSGGPVSLDDNFLDIGYDHHDYRAPQRTGLRFYNLDIPKNAQITDAYIQFEVAEVDQNTLIPAQLSIVAESADNAKRFRNKNNKRINDRYISTQRVDWNPPAWNVVSQRGTAQRTSDISMLVQSLVDRDNWQKDNGMVFIIEGKVGNTGARIAKSYGYNPDKAPSLIIEYDTVTVGGDKKRIEVMQDSLRRVLEKAPDNVNVGLMNYGQEDLKIDQEEKYRMHAVSGVSFPVTDINAKAIDIIPTTNDLHGLPSLPDETTTVREYIADIADSWTHKSFTPIVDAIYEAALYYRGEKVHYGQSLPERGGAHPSTYEDIGNNYPNGVVDGFVFNYPGRLRDKAPKYKSPITSSCQANYIVLMTDGEPTYVNRWGYLYEGPFARRNFINSGGPQGPLADAVGTCAEPAGNKRWNKYGQEWKSPAGTCGAELTDYLATHDNIADKSSSNPNGQDGNQYIETFTIGFGAENGNGSQNELYLKSLATYDDENASTHDDGYYAASTPEQLAAAFKGILEAVAAPSGTLASPGYSVNVKNGLENEKDVYIPVFDRKNSSRWTGNLKKFKIVDVNDSRLIRGKNDKNATDVNGNFTSEALDYWSLSTKADGSVVEAGGMANLLTDPSARKIVSNLTGNTDVVLSDPANAMSVNNVAITNNYTFSDKIDNTVLGLPSSAAYALRLKIVNFMRGYVGGDINAGARKHMGDMLHSEPVVITYDKGTGANSTGKQQYIFAATNEGYVHAIDAVSGKEKFAFIPKELLKIAEPQYRNAGTQVDHKYGVDGIMSFRYKGGKDGSLDTGDQIILYFGLRRGGTSYYALDVTDIDNPKLLWTKSASDYPSMGQSWSKPYLRKVGKTGSTCMDGQANCKDVVIISGGYDGGDGGPDGISEDRDKPDGSKKVDNATSIVNADVGNDVLILDALDGSKIWSMPSTMRAKITSSIPGGLRAIDSNQNKLVDRIYFGDTGGNVWRIDLSEAIGDSSAAPTVLTQLGNFGSLGRSSDRRMFFNEPEVSSMVLNGQAVYAISIGSGFRAHPMDDAITDKFYILVDDSPYSRLDTTASNPYVTITEANLAKIEVNGSNATLTGSIGDVNKKGWVISFSDDGEKVLSSAYSYNGKVVFSTLVPKASTVGVGVDQCSTPITQNNTYFFDIVSGTLVEKINNPTPGIPNRPQIFFNHFEVATSPSPDPKPISIDGKTKDADGKIIDACKHQVDLRKGTDLKELSGYNSCKLESVYWSDPVLE